MAFMNRAISKRRDAPSSGKAIKGLPRISYYPPVVVTLLATLFVFFVVLALTVISYGNSISQWSKAGSGQDGGAAGTILFCGSVAIGGTIGSVYFLLAVIKGVRDFFTPVQFTRGTVADKRVIGGRVVGNWIGVTPEYMGTDLAAASAVTDEQAVASTDRAQIVQTRSGPAPRPPAQRRGGYLTPERISSTIVTESRSTGADGPRAVFRVESDSYEVLSPGEEVLVAHTRYLEHIFYVAHLRNGEWESFRNRTLI
ncbi:MAG: hypothetical protein ABI670_05455 [Chloroflexota bacterium]